jgi:hypothetical protein
MGVSSPFYEKIVGGTVSPPCVLRKSIYRAGARLRDGGRRGGGWTAMRERIDIPAFKP